MKVRAGPIKTNVPIRRRPRNLDFQAVEDLMRAGGWKVTSRGWPRYFCWKEGKVSLVVPGKLNSKQAFQFWWFERHGIECYSWTKRTGFVRFDAAKWKLAQRAAQEPAGAERGTAGARTP